MATEKRKRGRPKCNPELRKGITDEDIRQYTDKAFWLNNATLSFFQSLENISVPDGLSVEQAHAWRQMYKKVSLEISPLAAQQATFELLFKEESGKPSKPKVTRLQSDQDNCALAERITPILNSTLESNNIDIPEDIKNALIQNIITAGVDCCREARRDVANSFNACRDIPTLLSLGGIIASITSTRSRIQSPMRDEAINAQRLLLDGHLTKAFKDIVGPISAWAYYQLSVVVNNHWGRLAMQTTKAECEAYAREQGQLAEDEQWDYSGNVVPRVITTKEQTDVG